MTRITLLFGLAAFVAVAGGAEGPKPVPEEGESFTATSANVSGAPDKIRIDVVRWSTDADRERLMDAWNLKTPVAVQGGRGPGGRGAPAPGRGGRGGAEAAPPKQSPEAAIAKALRESATVGYLWSSEIAGYAIRYAGHVRNADGSERVVLLTDRKLGAVNELWKPDGAEQTSYGFTLIELRLMPNGTGEGKASLTGRIVPDAALRLLALDEYDARPVVFTQVRRRGAGTK